MGERRPASVRKRNWKVFWLALPFVMGLILIIAIFAAAMTNEWVAVTLEEKYYGYFDCSIAVDSQDSRHLFVDCMSVDETGISNTLKYLKVDGRGISETILQEVDRCDSGSIVIDTLGNVHIIYTTYTTLTMGRTLYYAEITNGSLQPLTIISGLVGDEHVALAVDSSNRPHIVYVNMTDIVYAHLTEVGWQKQNLTNLIAFSWPFDARDYPFDLASAVDSNDVPHVAAVLGNNVRCCDKMPDDSWRVTNWSAYLWMGGEIDIASDSKGNTYVAFQAVDLASSSDPSPWWIYLGTLPSGGSWSFRQYIDLSAFIDIRNNRGILQMVVDEKDGIVICCTGDSDDGSEQLFSQVDRSGITANGTSDEPGLSDFEMGVGQNGHIYLVSDARDSLRVLTNTASIGQRISDLSYTLLLEFLAGTLIIVGFWNFFNHWREARRSEK